MAFDKNTELSYHIFNDFNISFDEKAGSFGSVRLVQWVKAGEEPDRNKAKYEIRKITMSKDGSTEVPLKGISISSKESMNELTNGLVDKGFGETRPLILSLSKRDDFKNTLENINNDPDDNGNNGELFDMRSLLLNLSDDGEDE